MSKKEDKPLITIEACFAVPEDSWDEEVSFSNLKDFFDYFRELDTYSVWYIKVKDFTVYKDDLKEFKRYLKKIDNIKKLEEKLREIREDINELRRVLNE